MVQFYDISKKTIKPAGWFYDEALSKGDKKDTKKSSFVSGKA